MPFKIFSKNSQKASDSKSSLLSKTEFSKLEKNMKMLYFTGLFQKNQATAQFIAKYQKAKLNSTNPISINEFLKSIYNETPQDEIPEQIHKLFVEIAMNEDIDSYNPVPADNTTESSTDLESSYETIATTDTTSTSVTTVAAETTTAPVVAAVAPVVVAAVAPTPIPATATTATKTILISSDTILFSSDAENSEEEEEIDFQAMYNTTTSFKSKLFNNWYKTKIQSKAFRINSAKRIKKLFTLFSKENILDHADCFELSTEENCELLGIDDPVEDIPTQSTIKPVAPIFTQNDKTHPTQPTKQPVAPLFVQNDKTYPPLNTLTVPTDSLSRSLLNALRCDHIMNGTELSPLVQYISRDMHLPSDAMLRKYTTDFAPVTPERPMTPSISDQEEDYDDMDSILDYKPTASFDPYTFPRQNFNQEEDNDDMEFIRDYYFQNVEDSRNLYNEDWEVMHRSTSSYSSDDDDEYPNSFNVDDLLPELNCQSSSSSCYENGSINPTSDMESEEEEDFDSSNIQIIIGW